MATTKSQNVCALIKYTDAKGRERSVWMTVGKMSRNSSGVITTKLDILPEWSGWDGTLMLFDEKNDNDF